MFRSSAVHSMERHGNALRPRVLSQGVFEPPGEGTGESTSLGASCAACDPGQRRVEFGRRRVAHGAGAGRGPLQPLAEDVAQREFEIDVRPQRSDRSVDDLGVSGLCHAGRLPIEQVGPAGAGRGGAA